MKTCCIALLALAFILASAGPVAAGAQQPPLGQPYQVDEPDRWFDLPRSSRAAATSAASTNVSVGQPGLDFRYSDSEPQSAVAEPVEPVSHPILSDVTVRRAIAYCTDKDALVAFVYPDLSPQQRQGLIAETFVPTNSWAYSPPSVIYAYNPVMGQSLLDQAGWTLPVGSQMPMRWAHNRQ